MNSVSLSKYLHSIHSPDIIYMGIILRTNKTSNILVFHNCHWNKHANLLK